MDYNQHPMKLLSVASARPNFVKLAAIDHAVRAANDPSIEHVIVHTGQHYDPLFSDVFFEQLEISVPAVNLGVHGGTREEMIERTRVAMLPTLAEHAPDWVLVYGDVNGAVGAAKACAEAGVRLAHVEAGLRSFDNGMPEELNRIEVDRLAQKLFCTEESGLRHLDQEKAPGDAYLVGNTMIDTLLRMLPRLDEAVLPEGLPSAYAVATIHRPSNVDDADALKSVLGFIGEVSAKLPVLLPVHHRLQASLARYNLSEILPPSVLLLQPQPYLPFLRLMRGSSFLLTDSGGIQEEAVLLRKRCFTLRRNTERPITVAVGSNILVDPAVPRDRAAVLEFAEHPGDVGVDIPPFWDGRTGERIVSILRTS